MSIYSITWKDDKSQEHSQCFEASSPTEAITVARERLDILRLHPNLITHVLLECDTSQ